jgi:hypothetical protein
MSESPDRIERTLEVLLYAPVGLGVLLIDNGPAVIDMLVTRGRAEIDRRHDEVQQRVTTARSLGEVALAFGPPMARQRVERTVGEARRRAEELFGAPASDPEPNAPSLSETATPPAAEPFTTTAPAPEPPLRFASAATTTTSASGASNGAGASSAELPIPGYDALSASQVVERLIGLTPSELDAVHAYETAHRQRRTILGKIEQLAG